MPGVSLSLEFLFFLFFFCSNSFQLKGKRIPRKFLDFRAGISNYLNSDIETITPILTNQELSFKLGLEQEDHKQYWNPFIKHQIDFGIFLFFFFGFFVFVVSISECSFLGSILVEKTFSMVCISPSHLLKAMALFLAPTQQFFGVACGKTISTKNTKKTILQFLIWFSFFAHFFFRR